MSIGVLGEARRLPQARDATFASVLSNAVLSGPTAFLSSALRKMSTAVTALEESARWRGLKSAQAKRGTAAPGTTILVNFVAMTNGVSAAVPSFGSEFCVRRASPQDAQGIVTVLSRIASERVYSALLISHGLSSGSDATWNRSLSARCFTSPLTSQGAVIGFQSFGPLVSAAQVHGARRTAWDFSPHRMEEARRRARSFPNDSIVCPFGRLSQVPDPSSGVE